MAYVSQDLKAKLAPTIKAICKKYNVKASIAVRHHSTLVLNIKSSNIDFIENYISTFGSRREMSAVHIESIRKNGNLDVNHYWYKDHFSGIAKDFLSEVIPAMNNGNYDHSDVQTDYFNTGWYIDVNVGKWNKPYELTAE